MTLPPNDGVQVTFKLVNNQASKEPHVPRYVFSNHETNAVKK